MSEVTTMPAAKRAGADIFVCRESFVGDLDGTPIMCHKGETRVRAGHRLLEVYGGYFEPVDTGVHYDVEQATQGPGEKRGEPRR